MLKSVLILSMFSTLLVCGCNQNADNVSTGETLANGPKPVVDSNARPLAASGDSSSRSGPMQSGEGGRPDPQMMLNKAFFMQHFVAALTTLPTNKNPNPKWVSPLK